MKHIAFTGHRPKDMPLADYAEFAWTLDSLGVGARTDIAFVTGGALGVDSWAARYALANSLPLHIVLPFPIDIMVRFWTERDADWLRHCVDQADSVTVLADQYDVRVYNQRNRVMVDRAFAVFAVWTGKPYGGTANCVEYAVSVGRPIWNLLPFDGRLHAIRNPAQTAVAQPVPAQPTPVAEAAPTKRTRARKTKAVAA